MSSLTQVTDNASRLRLPTNLQFLRLDGRLIFETFGVSGGIASSLMAVIVDKFPNPGYDFGRHGLHEEDGGRWYVIEWGWNDPPDVFYGRAREAITALNG
jgi:hypothetical protein